MNVIDFKQDPFYTTSYGAAYAGNSLIYLRQIPDDSVDLIMTSPPFALKRKKEYGNVDAKEYVPWFMNFAVQFKRILKETGSLVIDIGGTWVKGQPTRSLYHFELVIALCKNLGLHLAQEFYWYNPAKLPSPAEWVTVRRIRVKDAVDPVWWLSKSPNPKASNWRVLRPYSDSMKKLLKKGYEAQSRPSGHDISENFSKDNKGAIPPNLLRIANTDSNNAYLRKCRESGIKPHPARFPHGLPRFFIKFLTEPGDLVVDPFAGSNITGEVAEGLRRRWLAFDLLEEYLEASKFRFPRFCGQLSLFDAQTENIEIGLTKHTRATQLQPALLESGEEYSKDTTKKIEDNEPETSG
jgi:DNA modification methylase